MDLLKKEIQVPKEVYELARAGVEVVKALKVALKDGWQPGSDIPAVVSAMLANMGVAVDGLSKVGDELKMYPKEFVLANALAVAELYEVFKS